MTPLELVYVQQYPQIWVSCGGFIIILHYDFDLMDFRAFITNCCSLWHSCIQEFSKSMRRRHRGLWHKTAIIPNMRCMDIDRESSMQTCKQFCL